MKKIFSYLFIFLSFFILVSCNEVEDYLDEEIVVPTEIEDLEFLDMTFVYDGTVKSLPELELPKGYRAKYYNNEQTDVGEYTVKVKIYDKDDNSVVTLKAKLIIVESETANKTPIETEKPVVDLNDILFEDQTFEYDGTNKYLSVLNLPEGYSVTYSNNGKYKVGNYTVKAKIYDTNGEKVLTLEATLTIKEKEKTPVIDEDFSYHVVGGYYSDWSDYTDSNKMTKISYNDFITRFPEYAASITNDLADINGIYVLEERMFGEKHEWSSYVENNYDKKEYDGGYTLKVVKTKYDEYDEVTFVDTWNPDPKMSHVANMSPDTLYIPEWTEVSNGYGAWSDNPLVLNGEGLYTIIFVDFGRKSTPDQAGYAMAAIKTSENTASTMDVTNFISSDHKYIKMENFGSCNTINYDKMNGGEWAYAFANINFDLSQYNYLKYSFASSNDLELIIKFQGAYDSFEFRVKPTTQGIIDLTPYEHLLDSIDTICLFPAAGLYNVSGLIDINEFKFCSGEEPQYIETSIEDLVNNPPFGTNQQVYITEGIWNNKEGVDPTKNTYGNGTLTDYFGNTIVIYGFCSSSSVLTYDFLTLSYVYKNDKSYLSMGINDNAYVKVAMIYNEKYANYSIYLLDLISNGPEKTPEEYPEPAPVYTSVDELAIYPPQDHMNQIYIVEGYWRLDYEKPNYQSYGKGFLSTQIDGGNEIVIFSLSSFENDLIFDGLKYANPTKKDFADLGINDGDYIKVGLIYHTTYQNYYSYLIEIIKPNDSVVIPDTPMDPEKNVFGFTALDPHFIEVSYDSGRTTIKYDKRYGAEWSALILNFNFDLSTYRYLNYSLSSTQNENFLIKFECSNYTVPSLEFFVSPNSSGAIDLGTDTSTLSQYDRIVLFPAAGVTALIGEVVINELYFTKDEIVEEPITVTPLEGTCVQLMPHAFSTDDTAYLFAGFSSGGGRTVNFTYNYTTAGAYISIPVCGDTTYYDELAYDISSNVEGLRLCFELVSENGYSYWHSTFAENGSLTDLTVDDLIEIRINVEYDGSYSTAEIAFKTLKFVKYLPTNNVYKADYLFDGAQILFAYDKYVMSGIKEYEFDIPKFVLSSEEKEVIEYSGMILTAKQMGEYWLFMREDGLYLSYNSELGNYFSYEAEPTEASLWDVTIGVAGAKIENVATRGRFVQYNIASPRFSVYKNTMYNPTIYIFH